MQEPTGIKAEMRDQVAEEAATFESQSEIDQQPHSVKSLTIDTAAEVDEWNVISNQNGPQLAQSDSDDDDDASIPDENEGAASEQEQNSSGIFQTMQQRNSSRQSYV